MAIPVKKLDAVGRRFGQCLVFFFAPTQGFLYPLAGGDVLSSAESAQKRTLVIKLQFSFFPNPFYLVAGDDAMLNLVGRAAQSRGPFFVHVFPIRRMNKR